LSVYDVLLTYALAGGHPTFALVKPKHHEDRQQAHEKINGNKMHHIAPRLWRLRLQDVHTREKQTCEYECTGEKPQKQVAGRVPDGRNLKSINTEKMKSFSVGFYLQDGVEVLDFAGPLEVFAKAGFAVFTISKTLTVIKAQGVLKVLPDYNIYNAPQADMLVFCGGNTGVASADEEVIAWLRAREEKTAYLFSVCSGAFILGKAGLLDALTVTTFHTRIEELQAVVPRAKVLNNVRFVDNGRVITTAGVSAGIDGALHLVAKIKGEAAAREIVTYMEYDGWLPQRGLVMPPKP
jgi:putative intracellular protease/amidase